jgi:hypothetical protein
MECDDPRLLQQWIVHWRDLMDIEIVPAVKSSDTRENYRTAPRWPPAPVALRRAAPGR